MTALSLGREYLGSLKQREPLFYFADLLLPEPLRGTAQVLHAFHGELNALAAKSTEPMVGQIRFQWWQEVIEGGRDNEAKSHPLASQLLLGVQSGVFDPQMLTRKIEAHIFDLYHDPMPDFPAFEVWCGETRSVLFQQLLATDRAVDGAYADACGHAGVALGYADVLSSLPLHRAAGRRFLPTELLQQHELPENDWFSAPDRLHVDVIRAAALLGLSHLDKALTALAACPSDIRPLFSPLSPLRSTLDMLSKAGTDAFEKPWRLSQLRMQWQLFRGI
ncbi:squalene/phytoene synthase family protein [Ahrensia sp. R2A130]|uniref:phytoene/squalene synthase family protein n=1 Tax=Ahrensia sp. R2A130 TaxID=744979 RepID=UPI0001E0E069|nr:squalene/phytoene synthase family protein [Ahrensia sp. R2A130]EFL90372.1 squalene/phytoene synthase [Ahrensia sp. R2A130]